VTQPEYGIAGRLTDSAGNMLQGVGVELLDAQGTMVKNAMTDQFGLYRIDRLPSGHIVCG
jgi:hypothetical protein